MPTTEDVLRDARGSDATLTLKKLVFTSRNGYRISAYRIEYAYKQGFQDGEDGPWAKVRITFDGGPAGEDVANNVFDHLAEDEELDDLPQ